MNSIKAPAGFDEPVTPAVVSQAMERGRKRGGQVVHATAVKYLPVLKSLLISFADHSAVALPVRNYPELAALSAAELGKLKLGLGGSALCLDAHDLHVSIAGMVSASKPLMEMAATLIAAGNGSKTSAIKVQTSRANGQRGGRPRLVLA